MELFPVILIIYGANRVAQVLYASPRDVGLVEYDVELRLLIAYEMDSACKHKVLSLMAFLVNFSLKLMYPSCYVLAAPAVAQDSKGIT